MKIMIAVPLTNSMHHELAKKLLQMTNGCKHDIMYESPSHKCNENNYMHIAKGFYESDADFLIQIDSDNPPLYDVTELVDLDKDIIGCPTPTWKYIPFDKTGEDYCPVQWNAYNRSEDEPGTYKAIQPGKGLQRVDAVGAGCIVIAKRVFSAPLMRKQAWHRRWDKDDGTARLGLDLAFCERARKCGFEVNVHWDYPCRHFNVIDVVQIWQAYEQWERSTREATNGPPESSDTGRLEPEGCCRAVQALRG